MGRIQTARLEAFIRRWASIKGGGSVLSDTLADVFPILDLERLTPENQLVAGWFVVSRFATVTGVAAQLSGVGVLNPADSNSIAVIDKIVIQSELAQNVTFGTDLASFGTPIAFQNSDTRTRSQFNNNLQITGNANVAAAEGGGFLRAAANESVEFVTPNGLAILAPGGHFGVVSATVNSNLTVTFLGRTRTAEPSELNF